MSVKTNLSNKLSSSPTKKLGNGRFLWLAWAGWVAVFLLVFGLFAASLPYALVDIRYEWQVTVVRPLAMTVFPTFGAFVIYLLALRLLAVAVFWGTAVYIIWRKPKDWMVVYVSATLLMMSYLLAFQSDTGRWRFPSELLEIAPAIEWGAPLLFSFCFFLLFYLFPDGRFTPKWMGGLGIGLSAVSIIFFANLENVVGLSAEVGWFLFSTSILFVAVIGLVSQAIKWRQASFIQKQQTRIVLVALSLFIALPFLQMIFGFVVGDHAWLHLISLHLFLFGATLIPIAIGFSALRLRLWQMDVLLNRTLVYGAVTAVILFLYLFVIGTLGFMLGQEGNVLLAVLTTAVIAILFNPLRQRLQKTINGMMYGQRDDPFAVMSKLGKQLENTAVPDDTLPTLVQTITQTLQLPYLAIVNRNDTVLAETGTKSNIPCVTFPLTYQSQPIGQMQVMPRQNSEPFSTEEKRLLRNIARQAGTAVYVVQLTDQLQNARERLVVAREEERRRLQRDLHDGLGPQLATLTVKVGAVQNLMRDNPDKAEVVLAEIKTESQNAVKEIRRVVEGLRPATLDQLGLRSAIEAFIAQNESSHIDFVISFPAGLSELSAAIEVAVYRILVEAIHNTMRHAHATNCHIQMTTNGELILVVQDDGDGMPTDWQQGVGLRSMQERAEEVGGSFEIQSQFGEGTKLIVHLPMIKNQ